MRTEIKIAGYGGQGVALAGFIVGKAVSIYDGKGASMSQSYGPESRGGASAVDIVIEDGEIDVPHASNADIFVCMSKEAYHKFIPNLKKKGLFFYDNDLVKINKKADRASKKYAIPATALAEILGARIAANIVMLGFVAALTSAVNPASIRSAVLDSVPARFKDLNERAFDKGFEYASQFKKEDA